MLSFCARALRAAAEPVGGGVAMALLLGGLRGVAGEFGVFSGFRGARRCCMSVEGAQAGYFFVRRSATVVWDTP